MKKLILIAALLTGCTGTNGPARPIDWGAVSMGVQMMNQSYQQPPAYQPQMVPRGWAPGWGYR